MTELADVDVPEHIESRVEDCGLPRRLKDKLYVALDGRKSITDDELEDIVTATERKYEASRVDPLEPVGTVSAQSIGEPGTQMSIPPDERILVRVDDEEPGVAPIGQLVDSLMEAVEPQRIDDHEVTVAPPTLSVLSLDGDEQFRWKRVESASRHRSPDRLLRVQLESGRTIRATPGHSFVTRVGDGLEPVPADSLSVGDVLPVAGDYSAADGAGFPAALLEVPHRRRSLTDGGTVVADAPADSPAGDHRAEWERIEVIEPIEPHHEYVYDVSVAGLETFTTADGVVTHNTMNTFHYAGVAEIDVTQGLPRLIELVDARKEPDTPMMTVYLEGEYATDRELAHEVVWNIEATKILALGDVSTNVADMRVQIDLNEETLEERLIEPTAVAETIEAALGVETVQQGTVVEFGPEQPSYRDLLQLVEELRDIVFKGIEDVTRVVVRREERPDGEDEFVLYTEGSAFGDVLHIDGVDASRTTTNNIHEVYRNLGVEAAREAIIDETMETLREQGLDDVNVRHLMLVADIMTNRGEIESIGRHGIAGSKDSVLARAAYEVTVNHLLDAAIHGEIDDLNGVIENVIVGKPIKLGTGDVDLRMGSAGSR